MSDLANLIAECVAGAKNAVGSDYFSLEHRNGVWRAEAGELTSAAVIGELRAAFHGSGASPEEAVAALLANIRQVVAVA